MFNLRVSEADINDLKLKLEKALGEGYEVEVHKEVSSSMGFVKEVFDLVIFYHGDAICGVNYKFKAIGSLLVDRFQDSYISKLEKVGLKYGIVYNGENQNIYFWAKGNHQFEKFDFDNMVIAITGDRKCGERVESVDIMAEFSGLIPDELDLSIDQISGIQALFTDDNLEYDDKNASIWLKSKAEDDFFRLLLQNGEKDVDYTHVCRYTSMNSLFLTMKNAKHVMCSLTCMNDKGETSYADKYVGYGAFANTTNSIKENNDCFILSCCNKEMTDNLTMWRLYGNDGKGVCLEYDVDLSKIDNKEFFYSPVSYGDEINKHPVLDYIRSIRQWKNNGWCFELKRWYIWKHFFKSHLFKEEKEVRLLFVWTDKSPDEVEWIMDSTNGIASRICKFSISGGRLPLTLTNAIIGPKCLDQASNVDQFNYMNRQQKTMKETLLDPAVKPSKIEDYR